MSQSQNNVARDANISGGISVSNNADLVQAVRALRELLNQVEQGKQKEIEVAIEVLENAAQGNSVRKSEVVQAVKTLSQVPTMRQRLEELAVGASSSIAASANIEEIKFGSNLPLSLFTSSNRSNDTAVPQSSSSF